MESVQVIAAQGIACHSFEKQVNSTST